MCSRLLFLPVRPLVDDYQQHQHCHEDERGEGPKLRCQSALARIGVDVSGEGFQPLVADGEDGDGEVVDGEGEGEDESAHHARQNLRQDDLPQCLERGCSQVQRGFIDVLVHLLEAGHHAEHHVGGAEGDVRQHHRGESLRDAAADKEQEERHAGDDVRVHHRDGVGKVHRLPRVRAQVEDADGGDASQQGAGGGGKQGYQEGVPDGAHQRVVHPSGEERAVEAGGEACPVAQHLCLGEGEYHNNQYGRVEQRQQQPQVALCQYTFYHITPPLSFSAPSSSLVKRMVTPISSSMMSERAAP